MKAELTEYGGCFSLDLKPESMEEQVLMARLGLGHKKELRSVNVYAYSNKTIGASVVIGKRKDCNGVIRPRWQHG